MVHETQVEVRANESLAPGIFLLALRGPAIAGEAEPGRFVMLEPHPVAGPLLRRPMSFCQAGPARIPPAGRGEFLILYQVVGAGTGLMARLAAGDRIRCLGPLGRGFRIPSDPSRRWLLVAGGIGLAPFPFLAERLNRAGIPWQLLYGARSAAQIVGLDWFRDLGADPVIVTEDGSAGRRGLVTDPLRDRIAEAGAGVGVFACGPDPMLRAVADLCRRNAVPCQLALEAVMPCGFGVCLGCCAPAARPEGGYLRICTDGPVFAAEEVRI